MTIPAAFAVGARYDSLLQGALRQFFARATFETEPIPSASSDGRLAIEATDDPFALSVRWFGSRYIIRAPAYRSFTKHEVAFARAIGAVLAARYRALFDPKLMAERGDLFRGAIEDRYVGAFLDPAPYGIESEDRADLIASAIEVLRVVALSSYENRPISSGVLLLDDDDDPCRPEGQRPQPGAAYSQALTEFKSFYRVCDGLRTVYLANRRGALLDVVDIERWAEQLCGHRESSTPCAEPYRHHAQATSGNGHVCVVLSPSRELKVFGQGAQLFTFRNANWHLLDIAAKYAMWVEAVGQTDVAARLFQTALNLADAREGALFVVLRDPEEAAAALVAPADRLDGAPAGEAPEPEGLSRRHLLRLLTDRRVTTLDASVLSALATMDGATVVDAAGRLLAVGAILMHPRPAASGGVVVEGARTTAAIQASQFGPVLKVSEDGVLSFYDDQMIWEI
jgi:hypothetical protein